MSCIDLQYFPGWTRKAITFTIDDGNVFMDQKLIDIIKPYGIKGTFNITSNFVKEHHDAEAIRQIYQGFEIANHVKYHPYAFSDDESIENRLTAEPFPGAETADTSKIYPRKEQGLYYRYCDADRAWQCTATADAYIGYTNECKQELEKIFGEGTVRGFAWPYSRQKNTKVIEYLKSQYYGMRTAGRSHGYGETNFDLPEDWSNWSVNARHNNLPERGKLFEELSDDGKLKWLVFGVHSCDFERDQSWEELRQFALRYGNRPDEFWCATNLEIYEYQQALSKVTATENEISNPSGIALYIKVDGDPMVLQPRSVTKR